MAEQSHKSLHGLLEILNRLQANEHINIPTNVLDAIRTEIAKKQVDPSTYQIKLILRKLDMVKYYEYIPYILQLIY